MSFLGIFLQINIDFEMLSRRKWWVAMAKLNSNYGKSYDNKTQACLFPTTLTEWHKLDTLITVVSVS